MHRLKVKGWKNYSMEMDMKKGGVAVLISDKTDIITNAITKDKEGHHIILKRVVHKRI